MATSRAALAMSPAILAKAIPRFDCGYISVDIIPGNVYAPKNMSGQTVYVYTSPDTYKLIRKAK